MHLQGVPKVPVNFEKVPDIPSLKVPEGLAFSRWI